MSDDRRRRRWALHDTLTGEIRAIITATEEAATRNLRVGETLKNADEAGPLAGGTHYVDADEYAPRPAFEIEAPTGSVSVGGEIEIALPDGAAVHIDGDLAGEAEGGGVVVDFPVAGEYEIEVRQFPYRTARLTVVVE